MRRNLPMGIKPPLWFQPNGAVPVWHPIYEGPIWEVPNVQVSYPMGVDPLSLTQKVN